MALDIIIFVVLLLIGTYIVYKILGFTLKLILFIIAAVIAYSILKVVLLKP